MTADELREMIEKAERIYVGVGSRSDKQAYFQINKDEAIATIPETIKAGLYAHFGLHPISTSFWITSYGRKKKKKRKAGTGNAV